MYTTLIFDLDDTLTDDFENCKEAFKIMISSRNEIYSEENFLRFRRIDKKTWEDRAAGKLPTPYEDNDEKKKEWIRASRILKYYGEDIISYDEAVKLNDIYIEGMKEKVVARPDVVKVIKYLYDKKYRLIIATNGPIIPLETKINKLEIDQFVDVIFSAEEVGYMKPKKQYYEGLFNKVHIENKEEILFIGDDLEKDIKGGIENGLDTCWVNYNDKITSEIIPKYEIRSLNELKNIL